MWGKAVALLRFEPPTGSSASYQDLSGNTTREGHPPQRREVGCRIAVDRDEVGLHARRERADAVLEPERVGIERVTARMASMAACPPSRTR